ncbi:hypothetical protein FQZ97_976200 [compost metagenome]
MQCLAVRLAGQLGVHVTQIFMGCGVAGVGADGHFEGCACFVELALSGVKNSQVVVGLGQLGEFFGQLGKSGNGIAVFAAFGLDHAFEKAHLGIAGLAGEVLIHLAQSLAELPGPHEAVHLGVIVGLGHDHGSPQCGRNRHR